MRGDPSCDYCGSQVRACQRATISALARGEQRSAQGGPCGKLQEDKEDEEECTRNFERFHARLNAQGHCSRDETNTLSRFFLIDAVPTLIHPGRKNGSDLLAWIPRAPNYDQISHH